MRECTRRLKGAGNVSKLLCVRVNIYEGMTVFDVVDGAGSKGATARRPDIVSPIRHHGSHRSDFWRTMYKKLIVYTTQPSTPHTCSYGGSWQPQASRGHVNFTARLHEHVRQPFSIEPTDSQSCTA